MNLMAISIAVVGLLLIRFAMLFDEPAVTSMLARGIERYREEDKESDEHV